MYTSLPDQWCSIILNPSGCKHLSTIKEQKLDAVNRSLRQTSIGKTHVTCSYSTGSPLPPGDFFPSVSGLLIHLSEILVFLL